MMCTSHVLYFSNHSLFFILLKKSYLTSLVHKSLSLEEREWRKLRLQQSKSCGLLVYTAKSEMYEQEVSYLLFEGHGLVPLQVLSHSLVEFCIRLWTVKWTCNFFAIRLNIKSHHISNNTELATWIWESTIRYRAICCICHLWSSSPLSDPPNFFSLLPTESSKALRTDLMLNLLYIIWSLTVMFISLSMRSSVNSLLSTISEQDSFEYLSPSDFWTSLLSA